jgi:hypothetical protein
MTATLTTDGGTPSTSVAPRDPTLYDRASCVVRQLQARPGRRPEDGGGQTAFALALDNLPELGAAGLSIIDLVKICEQFPDPHPWRARGFDLAAMHAQTQRRQHAEERRRSEEEQMRGHRRNLCKAWAREITCQQVLWLLRAGQATRLWHLGCQLGPVIPDNLKALRYDHDRRLRRGAMAHSILERGATMLLRDAVRMLEREGLITSTQGSDDLFLETLPSDRLQECLAPLRRVAQRAGSRARELLAAGNHHRLADVERAIRAEFYRGPDAVAAIAMVPLVIDALPEVLGSRHGDDYLEPVSAPNVRNIELW